MGLYLDQSLGKAIFATQFQLASFAYSLGLIAVMKLKQIGYSDFVQKMHLRPMAKVDLVFQTRVQHLVYFRFKWQEQNNLICIGDTFAWSETNWERQCSIDSKIRTGDLLPYLARLTLTRKFYFLWIRSELFSLFMALFRSFRCQLHTCIFCTIPLTTVLVQLHHSNKTIL